MTIIPASDWKDNIISLKNQIILNKFSATGGLFENVEIEISSKLDQ